MVGEARAARCDFTKLAELARHLGTLIAQAKALHARVLLTVPYFDQREVRFVAENAGLTPVVLAHQAGALPDPAYYVYLITSNLDAIPSALDRAADTAR